MIAGDVNYFMCEIHETLQVLLERVLTYMVRVLILHLSHQVDKCINVKPVCEQVN